MRQDVAWLLGLPGRVARMAADAEPVRPRRGRRRPVPRRVVYDAPARRSLARAWDRAVPEARGLLDAEGDR